MSRNEADWLFPRNSAPPPIHHQGCAHTADMERRRPVPRQRRGCQRVEPALESAGGRLRCHAHGGLPQRVRLGEPRDGQAQGQRLAVQSLHGFSLRTQRHTGKEPCRSRAATQAPLPSAQRRLTFQGWKVCSRLARSRSSGGDPPEASSVVRGSATLRHRAGLPTAKPPFRGPTEGGGVDRPTGATGFEPLLPSRPGTRGLHDSEAPSLERAPQSDWLPKNHA